MKKKSILFSVVILLISFMCVKLPAMAAPTDEILTYEITADVNDDATVNLEYHIVWKVLDSNTLGPVEWLDIGIPNSHYDNLEAVSNNISSIGYSTNGGNGDFAELYFDHLYFEDEIIDFTFKVTMDYMYEVNAQDVQYGYTSYKFTPGWFDGIATDQLVIKWKNDKVDNISPSALLKDGYYVWETSLEAGDSYTVKIVYPNDAFSFDESKSYNYAENNDYSSSYSYGNDKSVPYKVGMYIGYIIAVPVALILCLSPMLIPLIIVFAIRSAFNKSAGFSSATTTKITRKLVEYYPTCQGCGATRAEGETNCSYCGRSFIKKEETFTEEKVPDNMKDILNYKTAGTYHYSSIPNTYVVVTTTRIPVSHTSSGGSSHSSHSSGGHSSCAHSSCAHSSCACASHCACACACACAGGGRAGCSNKDFYNTNLKMKYLKKRED